MEAVPEGFRFTFTRPGEPGSALAACGYTFLHHSKDGRPEVEIWPVVAHPASVSEGGAA